MNKSVIGIIVAVLVVLGGVFWLMNKDDNNTEQSTTENTSESAEEERAEQSQSAQTPTNVQSESPAQNSVTIQNFAFAPASITVKKGTKVTWTNQDTTQHSVIPDSGDSDAFKGSSLLAKGTSYEWTFDAAGTYKYHCGPHPQMTGTVTVTE